MVAAGVILVVVALLIVRYRRARAARRAAVQGGHALGALSLLSDWSVRRSRLPGRHRRTRL